MKRIIIILISSLIVFVGTLVATNLYVATRVKDEALQKIQESITMTSYQITQATHIAELEVSGYIGRRFDNGLSNNDTLFNNTCYISPKVLKELPAQFQQKLALFLSFDPTYMEIRLLVDPAQWQNFPMYKQHVPTLKKVNDESGNTLIQEFNAFDSVSQTLPSLIQQCKERGISFWASGQVTDHDVHQPLTYYHLIYLTDGTFFGAFALVINQDALEEFMASDLPFGPENSRIILYDESRNIAACYPRYYKNTFTVQDLLQHMSEDGIQLGDYHSDNYYKLIYQGDEYAVFKNKIEETPWTLCISCKDSALYQKATHIQLVILLVTLMGFLLMLLCVYILWGHFKKNIALKAKAEEELRLAAEVQCQLLKDIHHTTRFAGQPEIYLECFMRPAKEAGGDLYDYQEKEGKLCFCIGDVSGKGMPAALYMTQVVCLFRNALLTTQRPCEILTMINNVLAADNPSMTFCTMVVGVIQGTHLEICNAGHNPNLKITNQVEYDDLEGNLPVGIMEGYDYVQNELELLPGEQIILYTDGVTEARNTQNGLYGEELLLRTAREEASIQHIIESVTNYTQGAEQSDDITLVSIQVSEGR